MATYFYIRMSTRKQELSPEVQKAACEEYVTRKGIAKPTAIFADLARTGRKSLASRPEGLALLRAVRNGDHVVVAKLDRMGRNALDVVNTVHLLEKQGVTIHIVDYFGQVVDTSNAFGRLLLNLLASFAEWERELILDRSREARAFMKAAGLSTNGSTLPGFKLVVVEVQSANGGWKTRKTIEPDPHERKWIEQIFAWYAEGYSPRWILHELRRREIVTSFGTLWTKTRLRRYFETHRKRKELAEKLGITLPADAPVAVRRKRFYSDLQGPPSSPTQE